MPAAGVDVPVVGVVGVELAVVGVELGVGLAVVGVELAVGLAVVGVELAVGEGLAGRRGFFFIIRPAICSSPEGELATSPDGVAAATATGTSAAAVTTASVRSSRCDAVLVLRFLWADIVIPQLFRAR